MAKRNKPRAGSLAYKPRKRAKKETPRIRSWVSSTDAGILGFAGYKAGMTNVLALDNRKKSPTSGMEVFIPVTVIEAPPLFVVALRAYKTGYLGEEAFIEAWAKDVPEDVKKRLTLSKKREPEKKLTDLEKKLDSVSDIKLIVCTQPKFIAMPKKIADVMEIALGGSVAEKFEFAKNHLGKEVNVDEAFNENTLVDITAVTKGKGFQGVVKRYGVKIQPRKADKGRRHVGTGGAWTPARKLWREPLPGQMGYHVRTEYNKTILRVGREGKDVTPAGGFLRYGPVNNNYLIVSGSVPGSTKRLIRLSQPRRPQGETDFEITYISLKSKQGV
ncbi:MAG: 50S ribosomal protein L3 [Candidatus Altiarchaeota archaeon]|nr:50S ribosomal protein L3 [Candidatus Altiarchaeota archaeon]